MEKKILGLLSLSIFALFSLVNFASAATISDWSLTTNGNPSNVNSKISTGALTVGSGIINLDYNSNGAFSEQWNSTSLDLNDYYQIYLSPSSGFNINITEVSYKHSISPTGPINYQLRYSTDSNFATFSTLVSGTQNITEQLGNVMGQSISATDGQTVYLRWYGYNASSALGTFKLKDVNVQGIVTENYFCNGGDGAINDTDLTLSVKISNKGNGDDNKWLPLDRIEVEVELDNDKTDFDLENVIFELGLFKKGSTKNIIDDMLWISKDSEEIDVGDINENKKESHTFIFRVDPDIAAEDYYLRVKTFPDGDENEICIDHSTDLSDSDFGTTSSHRAEIKIDKESDRDKMVIVDTKDISQPLNAFCSQEVSFSADVYNIGNKDFPDQTKVTLFNQELGVDLENVIPGDLDAGDKAPISFTFTIPSNADEKLYTLVMKTYYDYDIDDDVYDKISDDDFRVTLLVDGNCVYATSATTSVSASLESGGAAGETMTVKATISNSGTKSVDYTLNLAEYSDWASSGSLSSTTLNLASGESKEVTIELNVKDDAEGEETFKIQVFSEGQLILEQLVSVTIEGKTSRGITGLFTGNLLEGDSLIWLIAAANVILITAIVLTSVKVMRKRSN